MSKGWGTPLLAMKQHGAAAEQAMHDADYSNACEHFEQMRVHLDDVLDLAQYLVETTGKPKDG